jgi:iron complex transport system substrate-binding protein
MSVRIVSLLPSATEIACALGLGEQLVGRSHECDFPQTVAGLPVVTAPKIDVQGASAEIDRDLRRIVADGLGVYRIDTERLRALDPDLIVTQDQCDVCAVSYGDVLRAVHDLTGRPIEIVSLRPARLSDVWQDILRVAQAGACPEHGVALVERLRDRLAALESRTRHLERPRLACIEWLDPLMAAGNWLPDLAQVAGGAYELVMPGAHSAWLDWQQLVAARPDVLCLMPCGFTLEQSRRELARLAAREEWQSLPAVRSGRVFVVDGSAYFNRPGPRLVESAEILAALLHPAECGELLPPDASVAVTSTGSVRSTAEAAIAGTP